jgi:hypothetical protein
MNFCAVLNDSLKSVLQTPIGLNHIQSHSAMNHDPCAIYHLQNPNRMSTLNMAYTLLNPVCTNVPSATPHKEAHKWITLAIAPGCGIHHPE